MKKWKLKVGNTFSNSLAIKMKRRMAVALGSKKVSSLFQIGDNMFIWLGVRAGVEKEVEDAGKRRNNRLLEHGF